MGHENIADIAQRMPNAVAGENKHRKFFIATSPQVLQDYVLFKMQYTINNNICSDLELSHNL